MIKLADRVIDSANRLHNLPISREDIERLAEQAHSGWVCANQSETEFEDCYENAVVYILEELFKTHFIKRRSEVK